MTGYAPVIDLQDGQRIRLKGMTSVFDRRDTGEDDCEEWDPTLNLSEKDRDCCGDGHYRCVECARYSVILHREMDSL